MPPSLRTPERVGNPVEILIERVQSGKKRWPREGRRGAELRVDRPSLEPLRTGTRVHIHLCVYPAKGFHR